MVAGSTVSDAGVIASRLRTCLGPLTRKVRALRTESDLTLAQLSLLTRIERDGPTTAVDLAAAEMIKPQSAAGLIVALEDKSLVSRSTDPTDRRRTIVVVAPKGQQLVSGVRRSIVDRLATTIAGEFDAEEQDQLLAAVPLLERLREVL